ncbi:MAG: GGDEF domain-containing protein [Pseudomonadales bacterium]
MAESEAENNRYRINPFSLHYVDEALERAYLQHAPAVVTRGLQPLIFMLVPLLLLVAVLDFSGVITTPVDWPTVGLFAAILIWLLLMTSVVKRFIEPSLILTFLAFEAVLLTHVDSDEDLLVFLPGFINLIILGHFVGLRFTHGLGTSVLVLMILIGAVIEKDLDLSILGHASLFLIPALVVASSVGYTIDKQRRRLFAQVSQMASERVEHEKMALHDPLTDLPNRSLLRERMEQSVARAKRQNGQFAVLFVDLDDFKSVNDSYGHGIGDKVLRALADNLLKQVRGEDTVARLGGDEFVILSEQVIDENSARKAADRIQKAISQPIVINLKERGDEIHINVTCSIGISLCPRDGDTLDDLISRADHAMYTAKRGGKSTARFFRDSESAKSAELPAR